MAGLTAWQSLRERADIQPGQRVLIHAAGGGVGRLAVQLATMRGAHVIGTASAAKRQLVLDLGADEVIDYTTVDFALVAGPVDVVIDPVGGEYGPRSVELLRSGGVLVSLASPAENALVQRANARGVRAGYLLVEPDRAGLLALGELTDADLLKVLVETTLPLAQAAKAHELVESGRTTGKVVLTVA